MTEILVLENRGLIKKTSEAKIKRAIKSRLGGKITSFDRTNEILAIEVSKDIVTAFKFMQKKGIEFEDFLMDLIK